MLILILILICTVLLYSVDAVADKQRVRTYFDIIVLAEEEKLDWTSKNETCSAPGRGWGLSTTLDLCVFASVYAFRLPKLFLHTCGGRLEPKQNRAEKSLAHRLTRPGHDAYRTT